MKTNQTVLGAAAFAVGALSSASAQTVESISVVIPHGISIQVNPLNNTNKAYSNIFAASLAPYSGGVWLGPAAS